MLSHDQVIAKWTEIKGGIRNIWGKISQEELDHINCNLRAIPSLIQDKYYDETTKSIAHKLGNLMDTFDNETDKSLKIKDGESSYKRRPREFEFEFEFDDDDP